MQERARRYKVEKRKDNPEGPFYLYWAENGRQRRRSTGLYDPGLAQALAHKLNAEEAERAVFGRAVIEERVTFAYAALAYCKAGETEQERAARERYMTIPIKRLGDYALRAITDDIMRDESRKAYPLASPATRRRQFYTPALAVMNWASKRARGWCERPDFDRPPDSKGRTEWVKPETAAKIILAAKDARARAPLELGFGADKDLLRLKEQGGWSSLKMVERYAKIAPRGTGAEAAKLGWDFMSDAAMRPPVENDEAKSA